MNTRLQVQTKTASKSSFMPVGRNLLPDRSPEQAEPSVVPPILHDILPTFQAKLTIGQPNDKYEQEADRVADQVMRMPEPRIQRICPECEEELQRQPMEEEEEEEETLQTKPLAEQITPLVQREAEPMEEDEEEETLQTKTTSGQTPTVSSSLQNQINALRGGGQPLPQTERAFFEPRFGADFSQVRVHADNQAAETASAVNAHAFTVGQDVVFGSGQYQPSALEGRRLLAHELTHVLQQVQGLPSTIQGKGKEQSNPGKSALGGKVCLTFDDGPGQGTQDVLDVLGNQYPATFFVIGSKIKNNTKLVQEMIKKPNIQIGNHTFSHKPRTVSGYGKVFGNLSKNKAQQKQFKLWFAHTSQLLKNLGITIELKLARLPGGGPLFRKPTKPIKPKQPQKPQKQPQKLQKQSQKPQKQPQKPQKKKYSEVLEIYNAALKAYNDVLKKYQEKPQKKYSEVLKAYNDVLKAYNDVLKKYQEKPQKKYSEVLKAYNDVLKAYNDVLKKYVINFRKYKKNKILRNKMIELLENKKYGLGLKHFMWNSEFATFKAAKRLTHVKFHNWQGLKGVSCDRKGFPKGVILFHDHHWAGKKDRLNKLLSKLEKKRSFGQLNDRGKCE